mmetsp:Transcript_6453/g.8380  ORF Transcript_6453/g.8380 Transcript_6453/m.8380 type:complete len:113 (+) Transcript_6453:87-425(+)|eukprot:CAMPEP_0198146618 /NCGR_PEP_ID=MMETSP1443-20131203/30323_1 /TAXON_ID=186043 /ORGANISM="Entomoneis sp., Strain CCMP2396" /LENGTH=112 /DNA_ID=CAMNT_0043810639 /DNA_START=47 /DNA_END=385 /DNA_ORIENTATION=+
MPIKSNLSSMDVHLIAKTESTESTMAVEDSCALKSPTSVITNPPRSSEMVLTRKRSNPDIYAETDTEPQAFQTPPSRKSIFLSTPRPAFANDNFESMLTIRRCNAFEDSDEE